MSGQHRTKKLGGKNWWRVLKCANAAKNITARTTLMTIASQVDHKWKGKPCVKLDHKVNKINTLVTMRCATSGQHSSRSSGHLEERGASISPWRLATWTFPRDVTLPLGKKNTQLEQDAHWCLLQLRYTFMMAATGQLWGKTFKMQGKWSTQQDISTPPLTPMYSKTSWNYKLKYKSNHNCKLKSWSPVNHFARNFTYCSYCPNIKAWFQQF